jgi:hypothetical protein
MTELPTKFKTGWKYPMMLEFAKKQVDEMFGDSTKEELMVKLAEILAAVNGVHHCLSALDSRGISNGYSRGSTYAASDLFPADLALEGEDGEDKVFVTKWHPQEDGKQRQCYFEAQEPTWDGKQEINHAESLSIPCTTYVDDRVKILETHESAMACHVFGGAITFGDVRILGKVLSSRGCVLLDILDTDKNEQSNNNVEPDADSEGTGSAKSD